MAGTPREGSDSSLARLAREAGSEEALSRSKWIAVAVLVVGGLGAIGVAVKPILRQRYAPRAPPKATAATRALVANAPVDAVHAAKLAELLERLRALQSEHQLRHPLWYGRPTPELIDDMRGILAQKSAEAAAATHSSAASAPSLK